MAIGDDASGAGYPLVPNTGEEGKVRYGAREINRTRDFVAQVKALILTVWPVSRGGTGATTKVGARANLGITSSSAIPSTSTGDTGDVHFRILT